MKHYEWVHWKEGLKNADPVHQHVARLMLGDLRRSMALSGIQSGMAKKTLPDGTFIAVQMAMAIPSIYIRPVRREGGSEPRWITYGVATDYGGSGGSGRFLLVELDEYTGQRLESLRHRQWRGQVLATQTGYTDPQGAAIRFDARRFGVNEYAAGEAYSLTSDGATFTTTDTVLAPGDSQEMFVQRFSKFEQYAVPLLGSATVSAPGYPAFSLYMRRFLYDPPGSYETYFIGTPADSSDVACSTDRFMFPFVHSAGGTETRVVVFDTDSKTVAGTFYPSGPIGLYFAAVSRDGRRMAGANGGITTIGGPLAGGITTFELTYDESTGDYLAASSFNLVRGGAPAYLDFSPDGQFVYATDAANEWTWKYDFELLKTSGNVATEDGDPIERPGITKLLGASNPGALKVGADGLRMYVMTGLDVSGPGALQVRRTEDGEVIHQLDLGQDALLLDITTVPVV